MANRNGQMAEDFLRRKINSSDSDSALKAEIGERQQPPIKRSASIEATNRGLKALKD
jgi:hypothetical protein